MGCCGRSQRHKLQLVVGRHSWWWDDTDDPNWEHSECVHGSLCKSAQDANAKQYTVKQQNLTDSLQNDKFKREVTNFNKLGPHPNIVHFYDSKATPEKGYILLELCSKGNILDILHTLPDSFTI